MYITDLSHFLDEKGAIAPKSGPARRFAEFLADVVAAQMPRRPRHSRAAGFYPGDCMASTSQQCAPVEQEKPLHRARQWCPALSGNYQLELDQGIYAKARATHFCEPTFAFAVESR